MYSVSPRISISTSLTTFPNLLHIWPLWWSSRERKTGRRWVVCWLGVDAPGDPTDQHWTLRWSNTTLLLCCHWYFRITVTAFTTNNSGYSKAFKELATPLACEPESQLPCWLGIFRSYFQSGKQSWLASRMHTRIWWPYISLLETLLPRGMQK